MVKFPGWSHIVSVSGAVNVWVTTWSGGSSWHYSFTAGRQCDSASVYYFVAGWYTVMHGFTLQRIEATLDGCYVWYIE